MPIADLSKKIATLQVVLFCCDKTALSTGSYLHCCIHERAG